jgi:hypothetical protein
MGKEHAASCDGRRVKSPTGLLLGELPKDRQELLLIAGASLPPQPNPRCPSRRLCLSASASVFWIFICIFIFICPLLVWSRHRLHFASRTPNGLRSLLR